MKNTCLQIALIVLTALSVAGQNNNDSRLPNARLEATAVIKNQKNCLDNSGFGFKDGVSYPITSVRVDVEFEITYKNTDQRPIILDKSSGTVYGHKIFQKTAASTLGSLEQAVENEFITTGEADKESDKPSERFVILAQGESFSSQSEARLLFDFSDSYSRYENKEYFISLALYTHGLGLSSNNNLNELRRKWSSIGYLWLEGIGTPPISIQFPNSQELTPCKPQGDSQ